MQADVDTASDMQGGMWMYDIAQDVTPDASAGGIPKAAGFQINRVYGRQFRKLLAHTDAVFLPELEKQLARCIPGLGHTCMVASSRGSLSSDACLSAMNPPQTWLTKKISMVTVQPVNEDGIAVLACPIKEGHRTFALSN